MIPETLLRHFEQISEAPDAAPALRRLILDLAIREKLAQTGLDPSRDILSSRLRAAKLAAVPEVPRQKVDAPITADELPFEGVPESRFVRLKEIAHVEKGNVGIQSATPGPYPLVGLSEARSNCSTFQFDGKAAIIPLISSSGHGHASMKRLHYQEGKFALANILCAALPYAPELISARFLYEYFSAYREQLLVAKMIGTANVSLTIEKIRSCPVPLVGPHQQQRMEDLLILCDELETAQQERERRRDRLVAASLHALTNGNSGEGTAAEPFKSAVQFYFNSLSKLTARTEHVAQIRPMILDLAVRGRLVPQNAADEPASETLRRIHATQQMLIKSSTIPRWKHASAASPKLDFACPERWETVNLGSLCNMVTSGSRGWAEYYSKSGPRFIRAQNIRFGRLLLDDLACVNLPEKCEGVRTQVAQGDILVVITGAGVTNPAMVNSDLGEAYVSQHVALIKPTDASLSPWILLCLMAPAAARAKLLERAYGAGKPGLNLDNIRSLAIPLPPVAEQRRILVKVSQIMTLCDELDGELRNSSGYRQVLLEASVHEALNSTTGGS